MSFTYVKDRLLNSFTGVTYLWNIKSTNTNIYISDALFAQDINKLQDLNIGLILNASAEKPASTELMKKYRDLHIEYKWVPISDSYTERVPINYISNILNYVKEWTHQNINKNILIHCSYGVNRAPFIAAAIIIYNTPRIEDNKVLIMNIIQYMRERQAQDRGTLLLTNTNFVNYLLKLANR